MKNKLILIIMTIFISQINTKLLCKNIIEHIFTNIFSKNLWHNKETVSGGGSTLAQTKVIRAHLKNIISQYNITSIFDAPCGDFNWMKHVDLSKCKYIGTDIVKQLIEQNNKNYKSPTIQFIHSDITSDKLPTVDLIFCRDLFIHFPNEAIVKTIKNFKNSKSRYLLTTSYHNSPDPSTNKDIHYGSFRPIDLEKRPFNLPKPILILNEAATDKNPNGFINSHKCLILWNLNDINL